MRIQNNISAMNALRNLNTTTQNQESSMEKLSSGYRINRAADDAAGLAISEKMRGQISGLDQASRNAQDGISLIQTAEGALDETSNILRRMRDLAVQSANDTNTTDDRAKLQQEVDALAEEVGRIASDTEFNTMTLLSGGFENKEFHIGANEDQNITLSIGDMSAGTLGVSGLSISSQGDADSAIDTLDSAIDDVSEERADLGAVQNRLEHTINNLETTRENLQASESRIRDTDMAAEMADMTKSQILSQAGTAMLAQANQQSQGVLQLLG
ncbi:flagellin [Natroniella sp. ANB-PHB2]|uniref:flagellin N-terminal helical domain-containing protein n=1 Tax=Natroniella sp. ANB-PHB2 TaxID=3384444 RepID=UPI0038D35D21